MPEREGRFILKRIPVAVPLLFQPLTARPLSEQKKYPSHHSFCTAIVQAQVQRPGEDQDDREHVHGGRGTATRKGGRESRGEQTEVVHG